TAEDISKGLSSFKVLNPELHICSLEPSVKLVITLTITKGRGFVPAEEMRDENTPIGTIPVDAIYTPIRKVNWTVENWRVEQKTDYEKLNLEIVTDGSISPSAALQDAANILIYHFKLFTDDKKMTLETTIESPSGSLGPEELNMKHLLLSKLSDQGLSVRAYNCLKAADIETFADLVSYSRAELMKFRNFGRKSLNEIDLLLEKMKLSFGMDVTKYNIEPKKKNV
ncbi:MAG: DNA-directed RNA polymerase subunit alpha, partial [Bacteroidales bacterium]|nr:DNA-directed RNA polymerase subunit alpha [Bacteroidales bacterium]